MIRYMTEFTNWRVLTSSSNYIRLASNTSISSLDVNVPADNTLEKNSNKPNTQYSTLDSGASVTRGKHEGPARKPSLVSAAFNSLNNKNIPSNVQEMLHSADTVEDLLSVTEMPQFSQYHALQALSILADWTTNKKIQMNEFEGDPRFVQLCKMLGPRKSSNSENVTNFGDLAVVLGVTGEDQAAKMVASISFTQKIRVLSSLALKKRRSIHLLRALAINIGNSIENLNIKEAADVLYAMSVLNFPDSVLLNKAASDVCASLPDNTKPAVIGSVLTSVGVLKYKNTVLLDALAEWVEMNISICREQDLVALMLTMASINYHPQNAATLYKVVLPCLNTASLKPTVWLDVVWSLLILNKAETDHLHSVLVPKFLERLTSTCYVSNIPPSVKMKLLNINAGAQLIMKSYNGPLLDTSTLKFPLRRSREKQVLVESVLDSLTNLLPTPTYLHTSIETDYGFLIDGECAVDPKCNPLPVEDSSSTPTAKRKRIAVIVCDYHDMCRECEELAGHAVLQKQILEHLGYKVMTVTYVEFNPRDKLVSRVKYLENKLKELAS